jgi:hypothetical protein
MPRESEDFDLPRARRELNIFAKLAAKSRSEVVDLRRAAHEKRSEAQMLIAKADEVLARR